MCCLLDGLPVPPFGVRLIGGWLLKLMSLSFGAFFFETSLAAEAFVRGILSPECALSCQNRRPGWVHDKALRSQVPWPSALHIVTCFFFFFFFFQKNCVIIVFTGQPASWPANTIIIGSTRLWPEPDNAKPKPSFFMSCSCRVRGSCQKLPSLSPACIWRSLFTLYL
jgi:hypothetical protein